MSRDKTIAEATANHLATINPALPTAPAFSRLPLVTVEDMTPGERRILLSPLSDEYTDQTRETEQADLKIALTQITQLANLGAAIETEIDLAERIIEFLLANRDVDNAGHILAIKRPAIFDWETAQKRRLFHSVIVLEFITT